jgi:hypothetical protein
LKKNCLDLRHEGLGPKKDREQEERHRRSSKARLSRETGDERAVQSTDNKSTLRTISRYEAYCSSDIR